MTRPTMTTGYTHVHEALGAVARAADLRPYELRVLVAIADRGGTATTLELRDDLATRDRSALTRAVGVLDERGLIDGPPRKRGVVSTLTLTPDGTGYVSSVVAYANGDTGQLLANPLAAPE